MTDQDQARELGTLVADTYFATAPDKRWPALCHFIDRCRGSMTQSTEGQRAAMMHSIATAIGAALLARDPSLQPHAEALLARCPEPDDYMVAKELGVYARLQ
jgi:hypothetical protein